MIIKNHFHNKGFALGLVLKQRLAASRKWPIMGDGRGILKLHEFFCPKFSCRIFFNKISCMKFFSLVKKV